MEIMVPSVNASVPSPSPSSSSWPLSDTEEEEEEGEGTSNGPQKKEINLKEGETGFLVRTPGCVIPDFDPYHPTITRFIGNPSKITCSGPPALTSSKGTTLFFHQDVIKSHHDQLQQIYKEKMAPIFPPITTKSTKSTTHSSCPNDSSSTHHVDHHPASSTPSVFRENVDNNIEVEMYVDLSNNSSSGQEVRTVSAVDVSCCYRAIYRMDQYTKPNTLDVDDHWSYSSWCQDIVEAETTVRDEGVLVVCKMKDVVVYNNVHYFIQRDKILQSHGGLITNSTPAGNGSLSTSQALTGLISSSGLRIASASNDPSAATVVRVAGSDGPNPNSNNNNNNEPAGKGSIKEDQQKARVTGSSEKLSVIIFGTDSVSRLNMRRHLPQTYKFLQDLGAVELTGYNKVGDNTFPNLVPILSGFSSKELIAHPCMPKGRQFDSCPWIFKDFKNSGYVTAFMEDAPWMGIFSYMQNGFVSPPTDYYARPFFMASEKEIGGNKRGNANVCQGGELSMKVLHDYSMEVVAAFPDLPTLGLYWSCSLTHDYLNLVRHADLPSLQYLRRLQEAGALNHSALLFLSDHGIRFGGIRSTYVGMLEERLPFVFLYLPPWFRTKYHRAFRNLALNAHRLTANYDLHQTLLDLANGRFADLAHVTSRPDRTARGISLFQKVPRSRTCADAGIDEHFCTCQDTMEVTWDDPVIDLASTYLMLSLNTDLDPFPACVQFTEARVLTARVSKSNKQLSPMDSNSDVRSYLLQIDMLPGGVRVEATLRYSPPEQFQVAGELSRITEYGNTSNCIHHSVLRKFCYCKDLLEPTPRRHH